ncbi:uncharacterized protein LOC124813832 isoform X2 [Hydra vulgaris]
MEIASSQLLKSIYSGQLYSYRHNWFIAGGEDKKNLSNGDLLSLLSEDQSHDLFNAFVLAFNKLKDSDYVFKVVMPESIVFLFANASNVSRIKAEVALSAYISERDKKRFCSSPEAYCTTDVDFSVSIYSENQLNKSLEDIGKSSKSSNDLDIKTTIMIDEPPGCSANITGDKNESVGINDNCDSKDEVIWKVGQKFTSIELVEACKTNYELKRLCQLVKSKVRSLEAAKKRIPKRIALANMALHYQTLQFVCKFSGKSSQPELERKRKTKSFRCGCPFEIVLELSVDNQHLQVVRVQE